MTVDDRPGARGLHQTGQPLPVLQVDSLRVRGGGHSLDLDNDFDLFRFLLESSSQKLCFFRDE